MVYTCPMSIWSAGTEYYSMITPGIYAQSSSLIHSLNCNSIYEEIALFSSPRPYFLGIQHGAQKDGLITLIITEETMSYPNSHYTVGWICAPSTEYVAAQAFLDERHGAPAGVLQSTTTTITHWAGSESIRSLSPSYLTENTA